MELYNKPNQVEPVQVIFTHLHRSFLSGLVGLDAIFAITF